MEEVTHILVVDDDTRIRDLLSKFLIEKGFFVSSASGAEEARQLMEKFTFDLIVMDVMMPGESGIELTEEIRKSSDIPILMLTAMGEVEDRISGLGAGADDYLPKPFEPRELVLRIENILRRIKPFDKNKPLRFGKLVFDMEKNQLEKNGQNIPITEGEARLLKIFCNNINEIISREKLATLFGGVNERSIDVQVTRLRNKIEEQPSKPVYLKAIRGKGYVLYSR